MTDLKSYDAGAICPKCGNNHVSTRYLPEDKYRGKGAKPLGKSTHAWALEIPNEHLRRTCARCTYSWNEAPIPTP